MNKYQQGRSIIGMLFLSIVACFLSYIGVIKLRVFLMDWEADRLCAKEGGIHIYEKAYLPGGYVYNWTANEKIFRRSFGCSNPDEHAPYAIGGIEIPIGRSVNPTLYKMTSYVMRCSDKKILGEFIRYGRSGGRITPTLGPDGGYDCKVSGDRLTMLETVFSKEQP